MTTKKVYEWRGKEKKGRGEVGFLVDRADLLLPMIGSTYKGRLVEMKPFPVCSP